MLQLSANAIFKYIIFAIVFSCLSACDDPYTPKEILNPDQLLVVEGFIELNGVTTFKLSKTRNLASDFEETIDEARLSIEGEDNSSYPFHFSGKGTYETGNLNLNPALKYRIKINLSEGANYLSDFVEAKIAPPIDSLYWEAQSDGVQFYIDTHDPTGNSRYYRWSFNEDWAFSAPYPTFFIYDPSFMENGNVRLRKIPEEEIPLVCYASDLSSKVLLENTSALSEDVIFKNPFYKIGLESNRLENKYSMLLKQYVLTKEAFEYWENIRKVSDNLGTLFDIQPYQLSGNIRRINSDEQVIGYISAGSKSTKRIFIDREEIPRYKLKTPYEGCTLDETPNFSIAKYRGYLLVEFSSTTGKYFYSTRGCIDCSSRGSKVPPDFWE